MNELSVDSVEAEVVTEEEPTATASTGESQTLHWNDLQNDAETESSSDEDEEEEGMAPESDHENIEEHAQGRMQYYVVEKAKAPVHTIPVVTPELEHPTAVAKECLEEDEVVVTDGTFNKGARVVVPEAEDHFDKIGKRTGAIVAKA
ncbi:hypothetical protein DOTSEDRAFT_79219 [Dothistroma septosporum NZE10]|uniref:Uncharacterized protein n=1 Tax=Dothistroma septosporum (strain NZE10 / CBS 128990) TaxID=675120 RepID=N1PNX7_DOTSN|nr:hypothetical protein DOTSEDRAFT_79219 [Dothistroma septosporum NZE10]